MTAPFPSIQSFYQREVPSCQTAAASSSSLEVGDGFTSSEVDAALNPLSCPWEPPHHYAKCLISQAPTGPGHFELSGRVVNFFTSSGRGKRQSSLEEHFLLVVSDGSAAIAIRLFDLRTTAYRLVFGQRVTVWTSFVADPSRAQIGHIPFVTCATVVYPGRNGATHIAFHSCDDNDGYHLYRKPLDFGYGHDDLISGLLPLKVFLSGGYDMGDGKVLVCVRSVGPRKTIRPRNRETTLDLVEVGIFDDTAACVLKLWNDQTHSAKTWIPTKTIILIASPTYHLAGKRSDKRSNECPDLGVGYSSMVFVDPALDEAAWLRNKVQSMGKKEAVLIPFPNETWDLELAVHGPVRPLFTIAEVDTMVRQGPPFDVGKLNLLILEVHIGEHWRKRCLFCLDCCGVPLYANTLLATCGHCGQRRQLSVNPRLVGRLVDESGSLAGGKLVWSDPAWTQLFSREAEWPADDGNGGPPPEQSWTHLAALDTQALGNVEEQLRHSRVTLTFGWSAELDRLCVLGVEW